MVGGEGGEQRGAHPHHPMDPPLADTVINDVLYAGAQQSVTSSPQSLDLSFLAGLNPDLYHSISHSLGILNDNGKYIDFYLCVYILQSLFDLE